MIAELGNFSLIIALLLSILLVLSVFVSSKLEMFPYVKYTRLMITGQFVFVLFSFLALTLCFYLDDFSVQYVANNSSAALPTIYKLCAVWGAHEGSLLLWVLILSTWSLVFAILCKHLPNQYYNYCGVVLAIIHAGFIFLCLKTSNPFARYLPFSPPNGSDLNPLLQDPGFVIHPPLLYLGYVGFALPFAMALAGLMTVEFGEKWVKWARPFALLAFAFLTLGIALGSWWAYYELGWGGWWFWDPVENASFMPWVLGAGFCHVLLVAEKRNQLIIWSLFLSISCFALSLIGTFLVRSGVLSSVHSFAADPQRGVYILGFLAIMLVLGFGIFLLNVPKLKLKSVHFSFVSKENFMFFASLLFFVATLSVLLGTLYPIITEVLFDDKLSVGPPYFNLVFIPIFVPILFLMIGVPFIQWYKSNLNAAIKHYIWPILVGTIISISLAFYLGFAKNLLVMFGVLLGSAIIYSSAICLKKSAIKLNTLAMALSHFGIGMAVLGIVLVSNLDVEKDLDMSVGDTVVIDNQQIKFHRLENTKAGNYHGVKGTFSVNNKQYLYPEKRFFVPRNMPMTETAILPGFFKDYYIALGESIANDRWSVRIYIKPFIRWIWLGAIFIALGAVLSAINQLSKRETLC